MSDLDLVAEVLMRHDTRSGRLLNGRVLVECDCPWASEPFDPADSAAWHRARWEAKRHEAEQVLAAQAIARAGQTALREEYAKGYRHSVAFIDGFISAEASPQAVQALTAIRDALLGQAAAIEHEASDPSTETGADPTAPDQDPAGSVQGQGEESG